MSKLEHEETAKRLLDEVKSELPQVWLGGRQRFVMETKIAAKLVEAEAKHKVCSRCGCPTEMACADCRIDLRTTIYVCPTKRCRNEHEAVHPARLKAEAIQRENLIQSQAEEIAKFCRTTDNLRTRLAEAKATPTSATLRCRKCGENAKIEFTVGDSEIARLKAEVERQKSWSTTLAKTADETVEQLRTRLGEAEHELAERDAKITQLRVDNAEYHRQVNTLAVKMNDHEAQIARLKVKCATLERSLSCIAERAQLAKGKGDSSRPYRSATDACAWIEGEARGVLHE